MQPPDQGREGLIRQRIATATVIVNPGAHRLSRSSRQQALAEIAAAFEAVQVGVQCEIGQGPQLRTLARKARDSAVDCVIAAGGDGTVSGVASQLVGGPKPLGILPLGTLNHFAKDVGLPLEIQAAAAVIAHGRVRRVDVGEVNGHVFINNSSIGLYPQMVLDRERRMRLGRGKWMAMLEASVKLLRRFPLLKVRIAASQGWLQRTTPVVFVGNNQYEFDLLNVGARSSLDRGELSLYIATPASRTGILRLALRTLVGRLRQAQDFEAFCLSECSVETHQRRLHVALDGEVLRLRPPLRYRVCPRALPVVVPS